MSDDDKKEAPYKDADGPLGPEKFENDLPHFDAAAFAKSHGDEFMAEMDDIVARILADKLAQEKKL